MPPMQVPDATTRVRQILRANPRVETAFFDEEAATLWIVGTDHLTPDDVAGEVEAALAVFGADASAVRVRCVGGGTTEGRVRFIGAERLPEDEGHTRVRVTLQWRGETHTGEAVGERAAAIELRTAAHAALEAVAAVVGEGIELRLTGVKQFRAFDTELVAVAIQSGGEKRQRLVGTVMETDSPIRAAAVAVLAALNRILGNYLSRPE